MLQVELDQVNASVLRKQHLAIDSNISDIPQIVEDVGGLHMPGSIMAYLSLFAEKSVSVKQCASMLPLSERSARAMISPLKGC